MNWDIGQWLLSIYILLYAFFSAGGIWSDFEDEYKPWQIAIDFASSLIGVAGCLFFLFSLSDPLLKSIWKLASLAMIAGSIYVDYLDFKSGVAEGDFRGSITVQVAVSATIAFVIEGPCWIINVGFAYI